MKGISEIVATVLVIALVVFIGGIVGIFVMNFTKSQTGLTQHSSENMAKCGNVILTIDDVKTDADLDPVNVTFTYSVGTEDLYNFSVFIMDIHVNLNSTSSLSPTYNATNSLRVGKQVFWSISTSGWGLYGSLSHVRVQGLCKTDYPVTADCKSGEACME
jgi:flagellin-like protein